MKTVILDCGLGGYLRYGHYEIELDDEQWEKFNSLTKKEQFEYIQSNGHLYVDGYTVEEEFPVENFEVHDNNENKSN